MASTKSKLLVFCATICLSVSLPMSQGYGATLKGVEILAGTWQGQSVSYLDREILVGLRPGKKHADIVSELGLLPVEIIRPADRLGFLMLRAAEGQDLFDLINQVGRLPSVEYAEPNMVDQATVIPDDPDFGKQWHYHNAGQVPPGGTADADVDAPEGWDITTGSPGVKVCVLDSGIPLQAGALSHPDLDDPARYLLGWDFVEDDALPRDDNGHGTHVTGTIAAETNNSVGVAGIDWKAQILAIKVFDAGGGGTHADFRDACIYAADNGCRVINYSGGGSHSETKEAGVAYAAEADVVLSAAVGNDYGGPVIYPAAYSLQYGNVIAVSATDHNDAIAAYSNQGPQVTVAAPGGFGGTVNEDDVYSTMPNYAVTLNGEPGVTQNYSFLAGTSMATPHVSGLASLILSLAPAKSAESVRNAIMYNADDRGTPGFDQQYGYGRINNARSLRESIPPIPTLSRLGAAILVLLLIVGTVFTIYRRRSAMA